MAFCPNCGSQLVEDAKFCAGCGTPVQAAPAPAEPAPAPAAPVYQAPAEPVYQAPAEPVYQAPAEPVYQAPAQPQYQAPAQPQYQAPQPQYQAPVQPQYQAAQVSQPDTMINGVFGKAIAACIMAFFPITSIIAIFFGSSVLKTWVQASQMAQAAGIRLTGKAIPTRILGMIGKIGGIVCTVIYGIAFIAGLASGL